MGVCVWMHCVFWGIYSDLVNLPDHAIFSKAVSLSHLTVYHW